MMVVDKNLTPEAFFDEYVQTYLERDANGRCVCKKRKIVISEAVAHTLGQALISGTIAKMRFYLTIIGCLRKRFVICTRN